MRRSCLDLVVNETLSLRKNVGAVLIAMEVICKTGEKAYVLFFELYLQARNPKPYIDTHIPTYF